MRLRAIAVALVVLAVAAVCVRLGIWQLSRLHEKRALNAALRGALDRPPLEVSRSDAPPDSLVGRRVVLRGAFDERRQLLLSGRSYEGAPGVQVVTPLLLADGGAVLVDRGWLASPDAATARPQDYPEPGEREVVGIAERAPRGVGGPAWRSIGTDGLALHSARRIDLDSLGARLPYALAEFHVRQLPGDGAPARPMRRPPRPLDEAMHASYAAQWFLFAAILLGGSAALAWSRRRGGGGGARPRD